MEKLKINGKEFEVLEYTWAKDKRYYFPLDKTKSLGKMREYALDILMIKFDENGIKNFIEELNRSNNIYIVEDNIKKAEFFVPNEEISRLNTVPYFSVIKFGINVILEETGGILESEETKWNFG